MKCSVSHFNPIPLDTKAELDRAMPRPHITPEQGTMRTLPSELDGRRVGDEFPRRNQA
jgi:hypothetical protein